MVELESENETTKLSSKINVLNKNVKLLIGNIHNLMERLDKMEKLDKPAENTPHQRLASSASPDEEKERVSKILDSRGVGRPRGDHNSKREQYLKMLNEQKIKQPKSQTLEFYKIEKDGDKYVLFD